MSRYLFLGAAVMLTFGCSPERAKSRAGEGDLPQREEVVPAAPEITVKATTPETTLLELPTLPAAAIEPAVDGYELLSAGEEPRASLRLHLREGSREQVRLTLSMSAQMSGTALPPASQQTRPAERLTTAEVLTITDERIDVRLVHAVDSSPDADAIAQNLVIDDRGLRLESSTSMPEGVDPQLRRSLETLAKTVEQTLVQLPTEPVGVGAKWKVSTNFEHNGLSLEQTVEFELLSRDGDRVEIAAQSSQRSLTTTFKPPNQAAELELLGFDAKGASRMVYDLAELLPQSQRTRLETSFTAKTSDEPAQELSVAMDLDLGMQRISD